LSDPGAPLAFGALADEGEPGDLVAEHQHDGRGRRTAKIVRQVDEQQNVTYDRTDYSYNESWQVLEERTGTFESLEGEGGARVTPAETPAVQWLWDIRYVDAPVLRWRDADADPETGDFGLEETVYYCQDANWNVTAVVSAGGHVVERYMYDAYGKATVLDGESGYDADGEVTEWSPDAQGASDWANERLFQGQARDAETGLYASRVRPVYHPTLGVFPGRDVAVYIDSMNLYQYCRSNPLALTDPMGLCGKTTQAPVVDDWEMKGSCMQDEGPAVVYDEKGARVDIGSIEIREGSPEQTGKDAFELAQRYLKARNAAPEALKKVLEQIENCGAAVRAVRNTAVKIGSFSTGEIDLGDIGQLPTSGAFSQDATLLHEILEQGAKTIISTKVHNLSETDLQQRCHREAVIGTQMVNGGFAPPTDETQSGTGTASKTGTKIEYLVYRSDTRLSSGDYQRSVLWIEWDRNVPEKQTFTVFETARPFVPPLIRR